VVPYRVLDVWIAMDAQDPSPSSGAPVPAELAAGGDGGYRVDHLSYALQWWAFALIPLIGWPVLLARVRRKQRRVGAPDAAEPAA
jgi:cytochrome oxidase assembly protein ShyY1